MSDPVPLANMCRFSTRVSGQIFLGKGIKAVIAVDSIFLSTSVGGAVAWAKVLAIGREAGWCLLREVVDVNQIGLITWLVG